VIYGPPKSCKTALALRSSAPCVYVDLEYRFPLLAELLGVPSLVGDPSPSSLRELVTRALKLSRLLYGTPRIVLDSVMTTLRFHGPSHLSFLSELPGRITVVSPYYLRLEGFEAFKVSRDRSTGDVVVAGPGVLARFPSEELFSLEVYGRWAYSTS